MRWLTDTRVRLGLGATAVLVTALPARRDRVGHGEAQIFRAINGLPDPLYGPVWAVMQLGALGAVPAAAAAALLAHDRELAGRLLAGGTGTWALSKLVKQVVRRSRPAALVSGARTRGRDASGLGYLSGHAGVAVAMGAAALPRLSPSGRALVAAAMPIVGLSRIYVGAHLPYDVAGGAGLGLAVEAAVGAFAAWWPGLGEEATGPCNQLCPPRSERCGLASGPGPMGKQVCLVGWATARRSNQAVERKLWTVSATRAGQYCPLAPYAPVAGGPASYACGPTEAVRHRLQHLSTMEEALQSGLAAARASLATALPGATPDASVPVVPAATRSMALTA